MTETGSDSNGHGAQNGRNGSAPSLDLRAQFTGKKLVIVGGTGFLGKVFWSLLLSRYPEISRLYLMIRPKGAQSAEQRFEEEIVNSESLRPLREQYGSGYDLFIRDKITVVAGDIVEPYCGFPKTLREELNGEIDAVINASGIVDFDPPLDIALEVNAFGVQNLVALARDLGNCPVLHTSTCFVAGNRTGFIEEVDPLSHPFPRAGELERAHWDADREIAECMDVIEQAKHRAGDAFRQSRFLDEAKHNLVDRHEPARGQTLEREIEKVRRKYVEDRLAEMGMERARFWGWANTYTYTKSIGEQIVASSGLRYTIARPAIIESSVSYPSVGWNEGINTSAPLIYSLREGQPQLPGSDHNLDIIPCDMVAAGMVISLGELIEGTAPAVYQYGSSDTNPVTMARIFELTGLYKRKYYQRTGRGGPINSYIQSRFEGAMLSKEAYEKYGPQSLAKGAELLSGLLRAAGKGAAKPLVGPTVDALTKFSKTQRKLGKLFEQFAPFTAEFDYTFRSDNIRAAYARLSNEDKQRLVWAPQSIDWREWFLHIHMVGLEKWVFPELEKRLRRPLRAPERHTTLSALLDEMAVRYDLAVALQRTEAEGLSRITFRQWRDRAQRYAARLQALGIQPGDRVLLAGSNHPSWPIAFFGILCCGATVVPLDSSIELEAAQTLARASKAKVFVADAKVKKRLGDAVGIPWLDLHSAAEPQDQIKPLPIFDTKPEDVAALIYTSGTTGNPKGVMLTHQNLTALVAALAPLFPLGSGDRVLSVLPLHHTFELTCGLLLPLSRGARVIYLDELTGERLEHGLNAGRITAMVGVPALWEMLERKLHSRIAERGVVASRVFDFAVDLNKSLGKNMGLDAGKLLFGPVHHAFGGHLRYLVSGGAALNEKTHKLFSGLGLHLAEGYGLTEASPVLTVASAGPKAKPGHVGKPIPGVELKIAEPNKEGVGEVLARGPNVMLGYSDNEEATRQVIDEEGWLHTGDLGRLDRKGNLTIVGRAKDTIVASNGENVYPDDVEAKLGRIADVEEYAILGVSDGRGGERVACVAVPDKDAGDTRDQRHTAAKAALESAYADLAAVMRPAVTTLVDAKLPRTTTRKVKRRQLRELVERAQSARTSVPPDSTQDNAAKDNAARHVRAVIATIARRKPTELSATQTLRGDLGFDSLMLLELLVALEGQLGRTLDAERLSNAETIGDVEVRIREMTRSRTTEIEDVEDKDESIELPEPLRAAAMEWMGRAQSGFYESVMHTKVTGRAYIPHNRNVIIAANHSSHLDMGLVKYALGTYGKRMISLAAQDYFFESGKWRKAYFDNLTNLAPLARSGSLRQALRQAGDLISQGNVVLLFPEGTRSLDGQLQEFKPLIGYLAMQHHVDILPIWLGGTYAALPKGATLPRRRNLSVRIGPPIEYSEMQRLTQGLSSSDASRAITRITQQAVTDLSRGRVLRTQDLQAERMPTKTEPESLATIFRELQSRFVAGSVKEPISYYFSLGKERWTMRLTPQECTINEGKTVDVADCVLKTTPDMFTRIVKEHYSPSPGEFVSGTVKSNNIQLLMTFQKVFQLTEPVTGVG